MHRFVEIPISGLAPEIAFPGIHNHRLVAKYETATGMGLLLGFDELPGSVVDQVFHKMPGVIS